VAGSLAAGRASSVPSVRPEGDAVTLSAELRRRQQLGTLTEMDMGRLTLADYVVDTWCEAYASQLSPKTWMHYRQRSVTASRESPPAPAWKTSATSILIRSSETSQSGAVADRPRLGRHQ
jgi:hypothetical protein